MKLRANGRTQGVNVLAQEVWLTSRLGRIFSSSCPESHIMSCLNKFRLRVTVSLNLK